MIVSLLLYDLVIVSLCSVLVMHQSFVTTAAPTYGVGWGIAGLICRAITFLLSPQCGGSDSINFVPK